MSKRQKPNAIPPDPQIWIEIRRRHQLSHAHVWQPLVLRTSVRTAPSSALVDTATALVDTATNRGMRRPTGAARLTARSEARHPGRPAYGDHRRR